jgi:hypothetical protein
MVAGDRTEYHGALVQGVVRVLAAHLNHGEHSVRLGELRLAMSIMAHVPRRPRSPLS